MKSFYDRSLSTSLTIINQWIVFVSLFHLWSQLVFVVSYNCEPAYSLLLCSTKQVWRKHIFVCHCSTSSVWISVNSVCSTIFIRSAFSNSLLTVFCFNYTETHSRCNQNIDLEFCQRMGRRTYFSRVRCWFICHVPILKSASVFIITICRHFREDYID